MTVVYRSFTRLLHLVVTRDIVKTTILAKVRTCLLEVEGNIGCDALLTDAENPVIITDAGIVSRFASDCYLFTPTAEISLEVNVLQQRFANDCFVENRQLTEDWQTFICSPLVLHRTADGDVFVTIAPILG